MTTPEFIHGIESYYGSQYTSKAGPYIKSWLDSKSSAWKDALFTVTLEKYSGYDGKLPNIAVFDSFASMTRLRLTSHE